MKKILRALVTLHWKFSIIALALFISVCPAAAQETDLRLDRAHTTVTFTLGDVLHTVNGTFNLKQGSMRFNPATGNIAGEVVVDAKSGQSGSGVRDRKMHREVLESETYPEISFRPDHVEGAVAPQGKSSVLVHGMFSIHGTSHEITVPAQVEMAAEHWTAALHFTIPYAKWGMKNPSNLFLKVTDSVEIEIKASGSVGTP